MSGVAEVELREFEVIDAAIYAILDEEPSTTRKEMLTLLPFEKTRLLARLRAGTECGRLGCRRLRGDVAYWLAQ